MLVIWDRGRWGSGGWEAALSGCGPGYGTGPAFGVGGRPLLWVLVVAVSCPLFTPRWDKGLGPQESLRVSGSKRPRGDWGPSCVLLAVAQCPPWGLGPAGDWVSLEGVGGGACPALAGWRWSTCGHRRALTQEVHHHHLLLTFLAVAAEDDVARGVHFFQEKPVLVAICDPGGQGGRRDKNQTLGPLWSLHRAGRLAPKGQPSPGLGRTGCGPRALP